MSRKLWQPILGLSHASGSIGFTHCVERPGRCYRRPDSGDVIISRQNDGTASHADW